MLQICPPPPRDVRPAPSILITGVISRAARPRFFIPAIALFAGVSLFVGRTVQAANTEYDVIPTGGPDLTAPGTYTTGGTPGTGAGGTTPAPAPSVTSDVTFDSGTYTTTAFTIPTAITFGSLNDLSTTALTLSNTGGTAPSTLTLGGAGDLGDGVPGANAADLLYVGTGASLTIAGGTGNEALGLVLGQSGNFDVAGTATISAIISDGGAGFGFTKTGAGTLTLSGANTYSGTTTVNSGTLTLSGSIAGTALVLGGGTFNYTAASSATQAFTTTAINAGGSTVTAVAGDTLMLGTITRAAGGTVNFGTTGAITTSTANTNNIIGGYATFGGTNFAVANGAGAITGLTAYDQVLVAGGDMTTTDNDNITGTATQTQTVASTINTLTISSTGTTGVLALGTNPLTFTTGGGLLYSGGGNYTISGTTTGVIGAGSTGEAIFNVSSGGNLTISALVGTSTATAASLTMGGAGTLTLTGNNVYTGNTTVGPGTLAIGTGGATTLDGGAYAGNIADGGIFSFNSSSAQTLSGVVSGVGSLSKAGTGTLTLTGNDVYTGNTTVVAGTLAIGTGGATTLDSGAYAGNIADGGIFSFNSSSAQTLSGVVSGVGSLSKAGTGTLTLTGAETYSGGTNIAAGTLGLSGGNDRLLNTGTVNFTGSSTLNLGGAISQTLGNITVANGFTGTVNGNTGVTLNTGTLTVTGASVSIGGTAAGTTQTLDLSGLGTFNYNNAAGSFKVGAGGTTGITGTTTGVVKLAPVSTITASSVAVGTVGGTGGSGYTGNGTINLGATATINANSIQLGGTQAQGKINYGVSTANPTLTLRGSDGSSRVTSLTIGQDAGFTDTETSSLDLTTNVTGTSTLDAMVTTLTIGNFGSRGNPAATPVVNATLLMGGGTLDATTIILGQNASNTNNGGNLITTNGTLTVTGGTVKVQTLSLGNQNNNTTGTSGAGNSTVTGTFNLNGGANLYAKTIDNGTGTGNRPATRTFNWNAGTIHNYDANNDLTINNNLTTFALLGTGAHTFNIDSGRQGNVAQVISGTGTGGLTKTGLGTLTFTGTNTYTGTTTVSGGTLALANTTARALGSTTGIMVNNGGMLLFNQPNQVSTTAPITLGTTAAQTPASTTGILSLAAAASQGTAATVTGGSVTGTAPNGGSITTGGTATGTTTAGLGALTLSNTATLAFAGGSTTLVFGTFTPNGNVLTVTGYVNSGATTTGSSGMGTDDRLVFSGNQSANLGDFDFGNGPGVGVSEIALGSSGFYEVTAAVPEPSTYVGCLMLLAGTAWVYRRRLQTVRS